jgi:hypothetical protein
MTVEMKEADTRGEVLLLLLEAVEDLAEELLQVMVMRDTEAAEAEGKDGGDDKGDRAGKGHDEAGRENGGGAKISPGTRRKTCT